MNKDKWFSIGYLIGSVILFFVLIGIMAWHYFHDHHEDTRTGNRSGQVLNKSGEMCPMADDRGFDSLAGRLSCPHIGSTPSTTVRGA